MTATHRLCTTISNSLIGYFQAEIETYPDAEGCVVVTPFAYPDLASIEFYAKPTSSGYTLTDEGETLNTLFVNGLAVEDNEDLLREVHRIARMHGVEFERSILFIQTTADELGQASQRLLSAIQATSYLIYKRNRRRRLKFDDEVEKLLLEHRINYIPNYTIRGYANTHKIAFYIDSNRNTLIEPITATTVVSGRNKAKSIAYKWLDLRRGGSTHRFAVVVDDRNARWETIWSDEEAQRALTAYSDVVIRWTLNKDELVGLLTGPPAEQG